MLEPTTATSRVMAPWKRVAVFGFFSGAGLLVTLAAIGGVMWWYSNRPVPPASWNTKALTATFDEISVEGDNNNLTFYYVLENNTDMDYKLDQDASIHVTAKLARTNSYSTFHKGSSLRLPIFIPAHKRVRIPLEITYSYPKPEETKGTADQTKEFHSQVRHYVESEMPNLDGFVLFDESSRYEVDFPPGWKSQK